MISKAGVALAIAMGMSGIVRADIIGFGGDGTGYSLNTHGGNSGPVISNNVLTLTDQHMNEANSVFSDVPQAYATGFAASFTYTDSSVGGADGFVFVLQSDPRGSSAAGGNGGSLGYAGGSDHITPSLGVSFNIYLGNGGSRSGIDDSGNIWNISTGDVDLTNGTPVDIVISYDAATAAVSEFLTQGSFTFTQSRVIDLASLLGTNGYADVGFTGGTGDTGSVQTISNFTYSSVPEPGAIGSLVIGSIVALSRRKRNTGAIGPR